MNKLNCGVSVCTIFILWAVAAAALSAQTFTTLHNFNGTDGAYPYAGLAQAANGSLYGTTSNGGANNCDGVGYRCGTVFKITPDGTLTSVSFDGPDGYFPSGTLIQATDGNLYGTTEYGGLLNYCGAGCGAIFKTTQGGTLTLLYSFGATGVYDPEGGLIQGTDEDFYGTAYIGGAGQSGIVFKITPDGTLTTLYNFCVDDGACLDGAFPTAGLVEGTDGNFYGTTHLGGAIGEGTVFRITPNGVLTTLHSFCSLRNCNDGYVPLVGLLLGSDGNLYGATSGGGDAGGVNCEPYGCGTIFKIAPSGILTTLYRFGGTDGRSPQALIEGSDGDFYGTTSAGGANKHCDEGYGCGTIFKLTPNGTLASLYSFCSKSGCADGYDPLGGLVQDTNGILYGTTDAGGANKYGTVFSLSVGLGPFVKTNPAAGKVGATVGILGTNLTGATGVKFNGTATAFRMVSSSFIEAKVPSGATSGTVQVQLPNGTLSSSVPFIVLH